MNDVLAAVVWCLTNAIFLGSTWAWSRRLRPDGDTATTLCGAILLAWAVLVVASVSLGAVGVLSAASLMTSVAVGCLAIDAAIFVRRRHELAPASSAAIVADRTTASSDSDQRRTPSASAGPLSVEPASAEPASADAPSAGQSVGTPSSEEPSKPRPDAGASGRRWSEVGAVGPKALWAALAALAVAFVVVEAVLQFPTDWDSLAYHIPLVDHWLREGTLYVPDCAFWYVPGNNELWALWSVAPFSGDFLVSLNNLPAAVLLAVAAVQLGSVLGLSRAWRHLFALAVVFTVPMRRQLVSNENDIAVAALFLAALAEAARYRRTGGVRTWGWRLSPWACCSESSTMRSATPPWQDWL